MRWFGKEGVDDFLKELHLVGKEPFVANLVVNALKVLASFELTPDGETILELIVGELDLPGLVVTLDETDEVTGGEAGIVESFEHALESEMAGMVVQPGDVVGTRRRLRRGRVLLATPLEDAGAIETPDGHAGGFYPVALTEISAFLPAITGTGGRVIQEEKEFVKERDRVTSGVLRVLKPMKERCKARNFR